MALVYLVNKPQLSGRITRWLLLFLEYEFTVVYKPGRTHVVDVLSRLLDSSEPLGVPMVLNYGYVIIFWRTYMDAGSENLFRDGLDAINFELSSETKVGYKGKTLYFEKGNYV
jgi:hypothetical protein